MHRQPGGFFVPKGSFGSVLSSSAVLCRYALYIMAATSISRRFYGVRVVVDLPVGKKEAAALKIKAAVI